MSLEKYKESQPFFILCQTFALLPSGRVNIHTVFYFRTNYFGTSFRNTFKFITYFCQNPSLTCTVIFRVNGITQMYQQHGSFLTKSVSSSAFILFPGIKYSYQKTDEMMTTSKLMMRLNMLGYKALMFFFIMWSKDWCCGIFTICISNLTRHLKSMRQDYEPQPDGMWASVRPHWVSSPYWWSRLDFGDRVSTVSLFVF